MVALPFPDWLEPMAATLTRERFTGPEWVFERKLDGIRLLAFKEGSKVRTTSALGPALAWHLPCAAARPAPTTRFTSVSVSAGTTP
jgi:ATP-dependent DNA ligase